MSTRFPYCDEDVTDREVRRIWMAKAAISVVMLLLIVYSVLAGRYYFGSLVAVFWVTLILTVGVIILGYSRSTELNAHVLEGDTLHLNMYSKSPLSRNPVHLPLEDIVRVTPDDEEADEETNHQEDGDVWTSQTHPRNRLLLETGNGKVHRFGVHDQEGFLDALTAAGVTVDGREASSVEDEEEDIDPTTPEDDDDKTVSQGSVGTTDLETEGSDNEVNGN